ncbi:hypothetical protein C8J56DRAFT_1173801 [Mycena floridula]|nr:hypothetical protein C8J56DRAFT_1173801 [Mycena floridula]
MAYREKTKTADERRGFAEGPKDISEHTSQVYLRVIYLDEGTKDISQHKTYSLYYSFHPPSLIPPVARTRKSSRFGSLRPNVAFIQSRRRLYFAVALAGGSIPRHAYTNLSLVSLFPLLSLRPITHPSRRRNNPSYSPRRCPSSAAAIDPGPPASPRVELVYLGDENRAHERGSAHEPKEDSEEDFQTAEIKEEDLERTRSIEAHFGSYIAMKEDPSQHLLI